jgi:prevent-host-death family protein
MAMLTVNIRDLSRTPKKVIEEIKKTKQPKQIVSQKKPQAVIVSLEDYERLEELKSKQRSEASMEVLLELVQLGKKLPKASKKTNAVKEIDQMWREWGSGK